MMQKVVHNTQEQMESKKVMIKETGQKTVHDTQKQMKYKKQMCT